MNLVASPPDERKASDFPFKVDLHKAARLSLAAEQESN